ncbi:2OG-Fe(II) oxygenase [Niveispirillum fermenti]|uniref:2OG-Fe(II) oxygenase family protein n=1 Tax=Niveispirillum fermenti TaxID=1233113 RepID=UPI003A8C72DA
MDFLLPDTDRPGPGEPAPLFVAPCGGNPQFQLGSMGGRHIVLFFPGVDRARSMLSIEMMGKLAAGRPVGRLACFGVVGPADIGVLRDRFPALNLFEDGQGQIRRLYGVDREGGFILIDPMLRVVRRGPLDDGPSLLAEAAQRTAGSATTEGLAPVLIVPDIFEPAFCQYLIALYRQDGGTDSGFMRDVGGKTVGIIDHGFKRRRDMDIQDEKTRIAARQRIERRLLPVIARSLQFRVTRMERYIVACYDGDDQGFFSPHRDNTTRATAHRRLAVSINLNAEAFEGGDLHFPEFGSRSYRPPTGGAVVFSCSLLHGAMPVTSGTRYAFLPFLYDEEGAKQREENVRYLGDGSARYQAQSKPPATPAPLPGG